MSRSLLSVLLVSTLAPAALSLAPSARAADKVGDLTVAVEEPFRLSLRDRSWNGDPHALPAGRAVLETADGELAWETEDVTVATASEDGSAVALLTADYRVLVSRLPETPRALEGRYLM